MNKRIIFASHLGIAVLIAAFLTIALPTTARAVEIIDGNTIAQTEVIDDDVFISGDSVVVDGTVNGDLFAFGNSIIINGIVKGSLVVAGQTITINGEVLGSLYGGSSSMVLSETASVGRNVYYGGYALETKPGSSTGRDLLVGGYQAVLSGDVGRDVMAATGALQLNGKIGRNVKAEVGSPDASTTQMPYFFTPPGAPPMVAAGLKVGDSAVIGGVLTYTSEKRQDDLVESQPEGGMVYQTPTPVEGKPSESKVSIQLSPGRWFLARLRELVTLLVLGGFALWLIPALLGDWAKQAQEKPLDSALWGLVASVVGYGGAFLLALSVLALALFLGAVTLGGLSRTIFGLGFSTLAFGFTIFSLAVAYGSKVIVAFLVGNLLLGKIAPQYADNKIWSLVSGVLIYVILRSIPFLGLVIGLLATLVGLGAIWMAVRAGRTPLVVETVAA